jgi:hypothetical protein
MVGWLQESSKYFNICVEIISQPINLIGVSSEVQRYMGKVFHLNNSRITLM